MGTRAHNLKTTLGRRPGSLRPSTDAEADLARLRESLRVAGAALWEYDEDTHEMTRVDSGGDDLFGHPIADWLSSTSRRSFRHPDDVAVSSAALAPLFAGEVMQVEYETRIADGEGGWRRLHHTATRAPEPGRPRLIRGFTIDVTTRRLEQNVYETLFESTVVGVSVVDADRRIVDCNGALCALFGLPKHEVVGRLASEFDFDADDSESAGEMARLVAGQLDRYTVEKRFRRADGTPVWARVTTSRIAATQDLYVGITEDLTERDRAEMQLRERTTLLTRAQHVGGVGSYVYYPHEDRDEWSPEARRIFGFDDDEADRGDPAMFYATVHSGDREWVERADRELVANATPFEAEYRIVRRTDGEVRWVRDLADVEFGPDGKPFRVLGAITDITERRRAETELREQSALLERAQQIGGVGHWVHYTRERRDRWSPEARRIFGFSEADASRGDLDLLLETVHPDDRERVRRAGETFEQTGAPLELEYRIVRRSDGAVRWIREQVSGEVNADGTPYRGIGVVMDITEQREAEAERREQAALLERAQAVGKLGSYTIDLETRVIRISPELARVLGLPRRAFETAIEEFRARFVHEDDLDEWAAIGDAALADGAHVNIERRIRKAGDGVIWVSLHAEIERDGNGVPLRAVGVIQDVTERREAEARAREQTALLERAQEVAKIGSFVVDYARHRLHWSTALASMLGEEPESRPVQTSSEFHERYVHEDDVDRWSETVERARREDGEFTIDARMRRANRSVIWVRFHGTVEGGDGQGVPHRLFGVIQDITAEHRLEQQLRQAQKLDAVGQLAGGIAHDFNNLLTVIAGNALLAATGDSQARIEEQMREILRAAEGASELVRQLLSFSRSDAPEPRAVDVNGAVKAARRMLSRLLEENIEVESELSGADTTILADPVELEQVLLNLAVNARDAMPGGGQLKITTTSDRESVTLSVADSGVGMDEHTRQRIFDPFFTTKPRGKGTGLGLSTVYGILTRTGARVDVDSELGRGTTFTIRWPRAHLDETLDTAVEPRPLVPGAGERILIVEDEPMVRAIAAEILSRAGYEIATAENGEDALHVFEQAPGFDLIVSDLMMPKLTGTELTEALRARGHTVPTVYTSGYPQGVEPNAATDDDPLITFIGKPYSAEALTAAVRGQLDLER